MFSYLFGSSSNSRERPSYPNPHSVKPSTEVEICQAIEAMPYQTVEDITKPGQLQLGDPIEFEDKVLQHWAIYAGEEKPDDEEDAMAVPIVVHFFSINGQPHEVRYDSLETASCGKRCRVNKKYDLIKPTRTGDEIMRIAYRMLGRTDYNILNYNCEHFVSDCRNGVALSDQVKEAKGSYSKQFEIIKAAVSSGFSTATYSLKGLFSKQS